MSYIITLNFDYELNSSLQIGDQVYHTSTSMLGGFDQNQNVDQIHLGTVIDIPTLFSIQVQVDYVDSLGNPTLSIQPEQGDYISFSKSRVVNNSDLLGYYASVKLVNNSKIKAELFSVGSEITENSK